MCRVCWPPFYMHLESEYRLKKRCFKFTCWFFGSPTPSCVLLSSESVLCFSAVPHRWGPVFRRALGPLRKAFKHRSLSRVLSHHLSLCSVMRTAGWNRKAAEPVYWEKERAREREVCWWREWGTGRNRGRKALLWCWHSLRCLKLTLTQQRLKKTELVFNN